MATKGYNSYHGRTPLWKKILIVVLVLLLLGGGAFLYCQNHLVYDENGQVRLELPFSEERSLRPSPPAGNRIPMTSTSPGRSRRARLLRPLRPRSWLQMPWSRILLPPCLRSKRPLCWM